MKNNITGRLELIMNLNSPNNYEIYSRISVFSNIAWRFKVEFCSAESAVLLEWMKNITGDSRMAVQDI